MCEFTETDDGQLSMMENPSDNEINQETNDFQEDVSNDVPNIDDNTQLPEQQDMFEEDSDENADDGVEKPSIRGTLHDIREENPGDSQGTDFLPDGQGPIVR